MSPQGHIPVNAEDLPIDAPTLEESEIYTVRLVRGAASRKLSKANREYCVMQFVVSRGDAEGYPLSLNYLETPPYLPEDPTRAQALQYQLRSAKFGRFVRSFKISGEKPPVVDLSKPESLKAFDAWLAQHEEKEGQVSISNQEYPEGSGRMRSSVNDFII